MSDSNNETRNKILEGLHKAFCKLVEEKKKDDGELVFADEHGKIIRVKAKDIDTKRCS